MARVRRAAAQRKLDALRSKDVDALAAADVFIPGIGSDYTAEQLRNRLDRICKLLEAAIELDDVDAVRAHAWYSRLSPAEKEAAERLLGFITADADGQ